MVALQDKNGSGKADVIERFRETVGSGGHGGTGIGFYKGTVYAEIDDRIVRYSLSPGSIVPSGAAETIVSGLPLGGHHPMHPFIILSDGTMLVDVASATNSCQAKNRMLKSPGLDPCTELETRGGIWRPVAAFPAHWAPNAMVRYDGQHFPARYRNGVFIAFHGSWDRALCTRWIQRYLSAAQCGTRVG